MTITYADLKDACRPGGASVLSVTTELAPAGGPHVGVAPPRYVRGRDRDAVYAFEKRFVDIGDGGAQPVDAVLLDSKQSALNRLETALSQAIGDGLEPLASTPRIRVTYEGRVPVTDLDLPHRAFDGHIRAGTVAGEPVTKHPVYRAARNATNADARALLELSPASVVLGAWDSTRKSNQVRFRSALVGEVIGVLADQSGAGRKVDSRGGARFDAVAPSVRVPASQMRALMEAQRGELSQKNIEEIEKDIKKAGSGTVSAARLGLGNVPPSLDALGLVSCRRIIRSHVLSFAALRQIRFGLGAEGDVVARALLAAWALNGLARSFAELVLRANCDLVEVFAPAARLDGRYGAVREVEFPDIDTADGLLSEAIDAARTAGVEWSGNVFEVTGNPDVFHGIVAGDDEGQ